MAAARARPEAATSGRHPPFDGPGPRVCVRARVSSAMHTARRARGQGLAERRTSGRSSIPSHRRPRRTSGARQSWRAVWRSGGTRMRIVVHGQQAFGKAVLEALLGRGEDVIAVYAAPDQPGGKPDPLEAGGARRRTPRPAAGLLPGAGGLGRVPRPRARPPGDGLRHAGRAQGVPRRPERGHDPIPPLTAASAPRAELHQLADHPGRDRDRAVGLLARRRARHRRRAAAEDDPDLRHRHAGLRLLRPPLPHGRRGAARGGRSRQGRDGAADEAGRVPGDLRGPVRARQRAHRLGQAVAPDPRPCPRLRPGAGGLDHLRRPGPPGLRDAAAPGARAQRARRPAWARWSRSTRTASTSRAPTAASGSSA